MPVASGKFDVQLTPLGPEQAIEGTSIARMGIAKSFHGDIKGTSKGEMLAFGTTSAGYVAMEQVTCTLEGQQGSFVLQHSGTMTPEQATLSITVVPDSGRDGLVGIAGQMSIVRAEGEHSYTFEYSLP